MTDEEEIPKFPFFSGKKAGPPPKPTTSATQETLSAGDKVKILTSDLTDCCLFTIFVCILLKNIMRNGAFVNFQIRLRESIIKQLKDIKELKDAAILSDEEFNAQREKLVEELTQA